MNQSYTKMVWYMQLQVEDKIRLEDLREAQRCQGDMNELQVVKDEIIQGNKPLGGVEVKINDFLVYGILGQGAGGMVKKAVHKPTKKIIALKEIPLQNNDKLKKQLLIEIRTLHECACDNVLRSYGAYTKEGKVNIALEFMDAGSLAHILKEVGTITEPLIGMITIQILEGLSYLHKTMKVAHRDIKPANILLNKNGVVKIADFGVSTQMEYSTDCMSSWVGTMSYMSPERLQGQQYYQDTDLWSLGIILIECATGKCPYKDAGFWDMVNYVKNCPVPKLSDDFSLEFRDFVSICLRKEGGTRTSAKELLNHSFAVQYADMDKQKFRKWIRSFNSL